MFRKLIRIIWITLLIMPTAHASDAENFKPFNFIGIKAGIVQPTPLHGNTGLDVGKPTSAAGISMGIKFHKILSADIEYMHRGKSNVQTSTPGETEYPTSWSAESDTVMLNLAIDLMTDSKATPYLKGGAGIAINESYTYTTYDQDTSSNSYYPGKNSKNFAWQIGCGINFAATETLLTELEYMFVNRGSVETQPYYLDEENIKHNYSHIHANLSDHVVTFGLKLKF